MGLCQPPPPSACLLPPRSGFPTLRPVAAWPLPPRAILCKDRPGSSTPGLKHLFTHHYGCLLGRNNLLQRFLKITLKSLLTITLNKRGVSLPGIINYSTCVQFLCLPLFLLTDQRVSGYHIFPQTDLLFKTIYTVSCWLHERLRKESFLGEKLEKNNLILYVGIYSSENADLAKSHPSSQSCKVL